MTYPLRISPFTGVARLLDSDIVKMALKVLVVDDEAGFRDLLKWELYHHGISVQTAENGAEAIRLTRETTFDLIITDIAMPEMDGLKLLDTIKDQYPNTQVIVSTGFGTVETAVYAMKRGAFDFVLKPYDLEFLIARVQQAVNRQSICLECGRLNHE